MTQALKIFLKAIPDETKRNDSLKLLELFEEATGEKAKMWGTAIVGFGQYHYTSERSSQEGDWMLTGFSPRKAALTLYSMGSVDETTLKSLGKCKKTGGCLYINKLSDIDEDLLKKVIEKTYTEMKKKLT